MEFFLDTADLDDIKNLAASSLVDGITTNPGIFAKHQGKSFESIVRDICGIIVGPVSVEVTARDYATMLEQGKRILGMAENIVLKLPVTLEGIKACNYFASKGHKVNMTLCFSVPQALAAAKAGAYYISPFIGRIDDLGHDGLNLLYEIKEVFDNYNKISTKILGASIRNVYHVYQAAKMGIDVVTMPANIMKKLLEHPMTEMGLKQFEDQWSKSDLKII